MDLRAFSWALALLAAGYVPLAAEELCVVCSGPAATYRCDAGMTAATGPGFQVLCIKEIATRGGHASCTIDRTRSAIPCNGVAITLDRPTGGTAELPPTPSPLPGSAAMAEPGLPATDPMQPKEAPPPTVEALAKATAEQTKKDWDAANAKVKESTEVAGQNLKNAGGAVGTAVKKSWDCVVSLFSSC